jgi:hypothetical protein
MREISKQEQHVYTFECLHANQNLIFREKPAFTILRLSIDLYA